MKVTVLGSGSRGNAIAFAHGNATILVDVGFGSRTLCQRARGADVDLTRLQAIVLTHEHGDHARGVAGIARRHPCVILGSRGTLDVLRVELDSLPTRVLDSERPARIGPFTVTACRIDHDAAEPLCVAVEEVQSGMKVGIAYDLGRPTPRVRRLLRDCTCLILEANHDADLLRVAPYPASVRSRIAGARGHMSNHATANLVARLCNARLRTVVLAHLSDRCNHPEVALRAVRHALDARGYRGRVLVASQKDPLHADAGETVQLSLGL